MLGTLFGDWHHCIIAFWKYHAKQPMSLIIYIYFNNYLIFEKPNLFMWHIWIWSFANTKSTENDGNTTRDMFQDPRTIGCFLWCQRNNQPFFSKWCCSQDIDKKFNWCYSWCSKNDQTFVILMQQLRNLTIALLINISD